MAEIAYSRHRAGGVARYKKYGDFGTPEGRRRGGINSLKTHKLLNTGFKLLGSISIPKNSSALAELLGILAGDGHIDKYQVTVTTHSETDREHAEYTSKLFTKQFGIPAPIGLKKGYKACVVRVSSKAVCRFLIRKGLVEGHKINSSLCTPDWIKKHRSYRLAFIRGLFDTDGCVFIDKHVIKNKTYQNVGMAFSNRCLPLLAEFKETLEWLGLRPTQKTRFVVFLRREADVKRYFAVVGSSNPKHIAKIERFFSGGVA